MNTLSELPRSLAYTLLTVLLFGLVYPLSMTLVAGYLFPYQARGSLVVDPDGAVRGSALSGQLWISAKYFHGRPSAAGNGYDPLSSSGTNLGPTSKKLIDSVRANAKKLARENPGAPVKIPTDLLTSSGSGLDPDISIEAAYYQAPRVAHARGLSLARIRAFVEAHITPRTFGFLGEAHVNVLTLNRALDALGAKP
jgi:K+-transporting ATPase ATPase C chain